MGAHAQAPPAAEAPAEVPVAEATRPALAEGDEERLICRREKTIGSNRTTRVCRTQAQIREQSQAAQDGLTRDASLPSPAGN